MDRAKLINRLVARKIESKANARPICICMAGVGKALCFAAGSKVARQPANAKS